MFLILCPTDKRIVHISSSMDYEKNGNYILDSGLRVVRSIADCEEVTEIPSYVEPEKYLYVNGEFVENPNYVSEDRLTDEELVTMVEEIL